MTTKLKTIKLSDGHSPAGNLSNPTLRSEEAWKKAQRFRVELVTNSVEFHTGQLLERNEVEALCVSKEWSVTVVPIK